MSQTYNAKSVQKLTFREGCQKRIGIYLGSADMEGVMNGFLEIVNNATDEYIVYPTANLIEIQVEDKCISCSDKGRGIPHGQNDFSKEVMIDLLTENHSGAKFDEDSYGGKSRGLNGTGSAATCCSSDWFEVESKRDGYYWTLKFVNGVPTTQTAIRGDKTKETGTTIRYQPSQQVFSAEEIHFNFEKICNLMEEYSYFNPGITFSVTNIITKENKKYCSKNGLKDFATKKIQNPVHKTPIYFSLSENDIDMEIICQWTRGEEKFYLFSNGAENAGGGTPITGIRTSITRNMKKLYKIDGDGDIIRNGLVYIISIKLKNPIYTGQIKDKISNPELRALSDKAFTEGLKDFQQKYPNDIELIKDFLVREQKADEAAEKARAKILNAVKETKEASGKKIYRTDKFKDCEQHGANSMLIISEGCSASGALSRARNTDTEALYAIRGKIINLLRNPLDECLENEEVKDIIAILGCGILDEYKSSKLKFGRVAMAVDSDAGLSA